MKNYSVSIIILLMYVLMSSCVKTENIVWPEEVTLPIVVKDTAVQMVAEVVEDSYDFLHAKELFVYKDTIIIISNNPDSKNHFIEFYNVNSKQIIRKLIRKGNGPGEMLNAMSHIQGNMLCVHDFVKNQLAYINIDSVLYDKNYKLPNFVKFNGVDSPFVTMFNCDSIIFENPYYFKDNGLNIDNRQPRLIVTDANSDYLFKDIRKYYAYNVSQGFITMNKAKNRLIYASTVLNEMEVYDMNLTPIKLVRGPDKLKADYVVKENSISFNGFAPYSYRKYCTDENGYYVSYIGDYYNPKKSLSDFKSYIFQFDWDGNFIKSYSVPVYINAISKSPDKEIFYGRGVDKDGSVVLWRLTLL